MANFIPQEKIAEIQLASDIVHVISEYVSLKQSGKNFLGLCPFHSEKTPSFTVNPGKEAL
jgi:DNA primase (EC 2.7.7.-)